MDTHQNLPLKAKFSQKRFFDLQQKMVLGLLMYRLQVKQIGEKCVIIFTYRNKFNVEGIKNSCFI